VRWLLLLVLGSAAGHGPAFADGHQPRVAVGAGESFFTGSYSGFVHDLAAGVRFMPDLWATGRVSLENSMHEGNLDDSEMEDFQAISLVVSRDYHPWIFGGGLGAQRFDHEVNCGDCVFLESDDQAFAEVRVAVRGSVETWFAVELASTARIGTDWRQAGLGFTVYFTP